jgi:hypothetical protein
MTAPSALYGLMAEFDGPEELVRAARRTRAAGYRRVNAYSPFSIEELSEALDFSQTPIPLIMLLGGLAGAIGGYFLQFYISVMSYPINVGGRPYNSWQEFVPVTFELTVLCSALAGLVGMLVLNGLPEPYHPVFNVPSFARASRDRFFLLIEARDPQFDRDRTRHFLSSLGPREVADVPA